MTDTRELEGMASRPAAEHTFAVQEFDELAGLAQDIFGGEACGTFNVVILLCNLCYFTLLFACKYIVFNI